MVRGGTFAVKAETVLIPSKSENDKAEYCGSCSSGGQKGWASEGESNQKITSLTTEGFALFETHADPVTGSTAMRAGLMME